MFSVYRNVFFQKEDSPVKTFCYRDRDDRRATYWRGKGVEPGRVNSLLPAEEPPNASGLE